MTLVVLGISGSLTPGRSRTRTALEAALAGVEAHEAGVDTEVLDLRDHELEFCDGRRPDEYGAGTRRAIERIEAADAYLVATPMYRASYTGALKNLFDLVPNEAGGRDPLRGKAVGLIATGGSDHHYLALEHELRPLMAFFGAHAVSRSVYLSRDDFDAERDVQPGKAEELSRLGAEVASLASFLRDQPAGFHAEHLRIRRD